MGLIPHQSVKGNAMNQVRFSSKAILVLAAVLGITMMTGSAGVLIFAQESGGLPQGFKKGDLAPLPSAEMIEAGKRVYFTKCVWCHGVDGAGDGPGADRLWPRPRRPRSRSACCTPSPERWPSARRR